MIFRVISFIFLLIFIWLLIGSYKQIKKDYAISDNIDFLFNIFWFIGVAWGVITLFLYAFFDISIVLAIKHW
jgi:hypothetical protein